MNPSRKHLLPATLILLGASLLGACTTRRAVFVTKTSLSVLDADTTPASVSIAYDRVEGFVGPGYENGSAAPVTAIIESDGELFNPKIKQLYATGNASKIIAGGPRLDSPELGGECEPLLFGTTTNIGLKLTFMTSSVVPNSINFGFRRKEFSVIPIGTKDNKDYYPSVLASIDNTNSLGAHDGTTLKVKQVFATGAAADSLASSLRGEFLHRIAAATGLLDPEATGADRRAKLAVLDTIIQQLEGDHNAEAVELLAQLNAVDYSSLTPAFKSYSGAGSANTLKIDDVAAVPKGQPFDKVNTYYGNLSDSIDHLTQNLEPKINPNLNILAADSTKPATLSQVNEAKDALAAQRKLQANLQKRMANEPTVLAVLNYFARKISNP